MDVVTMTRVYWDTMIFIYQFEARDELAARVGEIEHEMVARGDRVCASPLSYGELLAGPRRRNNFAGEQAIQEYFRSGEVEVLPIGMEAGDRFGQIRAAAKVSVADALHLAVAAAAGVDLFLTHDRRLHGLKVPGIDFIAGLDTDLY